MEFLRTEFETASVFATIAADAKDPEKHRRNVCNSRKGYDTLLHFLRTFSLTPDESAEMQVKIEKLRTRLIELGERL